MSDLRLDMLRVLPPFRGMEDVIDPDQSTRSIVKEMLQAHRIFADHYDTIADLWMTGQLNRVPRRLFDFCASKLRYVEEDTEEQTTRSPAGILVMREVDCKHYSGFIAGVLDAINRTGAYYYDWYYRFASEDLLDPRPHHVFIVIKGEDEKEVWIDPVPNVGGYDTRPVYYWRYDKKPKTMALKRLSGTTKQGFTSITTVSRGSMAAPTMARPIGKVQQVNPLSGYNGPAKIGANQDAEKTLQDALKAYELGLVNSVANLTKNNQVDGNIDTILQSAAASAVPGAAAAMQAVNSLVAASSSLFGPGSVLTRILDAATGNILLAPINIIKAAFGGRTYYLDKYWLFNDYSWHVLGYSSGSSDGVKDSDVPVAAQWFITKLGIFISSRTFLGELRKGVDNYMALHSGNPYTTMDRVRVQLARDVLLKYMPDELTPAGNWKNTVGVYDNAVTAAIERARINDPAALTDSTGSIKTGLEATASTVMNYIKANPLPSLLIGGAVGFGLYELLKNDGRRRRK